MDLFNPAWELLSELKASSRTPLEAFPSPALLAACAEINSYLRARGGREPWKANRGEVRAAAASEMFGKGTARSPRLVREESFPGEESHAGMVLRNVLEESNQF